MSTAGEFTLTATGDLMFCGVVRNALATHADPLWGLRPLGGALLEGDLLFGNFETPISAARCHEPDAPDKYWCPPGVGRALREYGFDVVNLAHNHIYDFGAEGVEATTTELRAAGLPFVGIGRTTDEAAAPAVVTTRTGVPVGFLGYTTAVNALDPRHAYVACYPGPARVAEDIRRLRARVETVVVSCHSGAQYNPYPAPETRALARAALEAGAAVFLGHHPHVPQGCEPIGRGLAVYSLGDFLAPVWNEQTRRTFFVRVRIDGAAVIRHELVPCCVTDHGQTTLATGALQAEIGTHLAELSRAIAEGRSDALHFATARGRFFSQYLTSWIQELRTGGPRVLMRKFRNLRGYHLQLIVQALFGWLNRRRK
jgi:poly-gamma-glutamate synthesis protein (capsule biosynthesis protein)